MKLKQQKKLFEKLSEGKKIRYSTALINYNMDHFRHFLSAIFPMFLILILLGNPLIYVLLGLKNVAILTMVIFAVTIVSFIIGIKRRLENIKLLDAFLKEHGK